ncbi:MAG: hypothetical protein MUP11_12305, partial [Anaerolineales bacterium]|nr:hypothetical protein [Anaerolineales bacterium]
MENQKTPNLQALSQGLLNLSGLGLGYLFQKRWKRWGIHFLITLTLLATAYLTNGSRLPLVWIPVFCIWLAWMAVDGWRLGRNLVPEQSLLPLALDLPKNRHWLLLAVPLLLLVLESAGLAGYYLLGQKSFQLGNQAYLQADCKTAEVRFRQVTTLYELTMSPKIALADARLAECDLLLSAEKAHQDGEYQLAINLYQEYLDLDSEEQLTAFTEEGLAGAYADWANELMTAKDFQGAINKFDIILATYPETTAAGHVAAPLSESWLQLSTQLWKADDYQEAVDSALTSLEDYPSTPAGKLAANQVAEIYLDWAADLQSDDQYPEAIEKITHLMDEYPDLLVEENGVALVAEIYYDWASFLFKTNDFGLSIEKYEIILKEYSDYYSLSTINQDLKSSYLAWGIELREIDNFNQAIDIYQTFQEDYPQTAQTVDTPQLIIETQLEWAENLTQEKKFIQALEKFTEIKDQ